jgi:hypothetical protein
MKSARKLVALAAAGVAAAALVAPTGAAWAGNHSQASTPKLELTVSAPDPATGLPTATAAWVGNPKDNPVLQVFTKDNPDGDGNYSYFAGEVTNTPVNGEALGDVNNIAFDYRGPLGAGAPRISLELSDGSYVYLSAGYSSKSLDDGWVQFNTDDRTGTQHNTLGGSGPAVIWDSQGHAYTTDGGGTAWAHMAVDHGVTTTITGIALVQDENHGIVQFDNIRFDTVVFVKGGVKGGYVTVAPVV